MKGEEGWEDRLSRGEWPREVLASQLRHFAPFCGENDRADRREDNLGKNSAES